MIGLLMWLVYGLIVGLIAKALMPGEEGLTTLQTIALGVGGSYLAGFVDFLLGGSDHIHPTGFLMGIVGSCALIWIVNYFVKNKE